MRGAASAALYGAILAATVGLLCALPAQARADAGSTSLIGLKANLTDEGAVIELHTSGSGSFTVDRFAPGDFVTVWCAGLSPEIDNSKPELDLANFRLGKLIKGAELVEGSSRSGLRFSVSAEADRSAAYVVPRDGYSELYIPYKGAAPRPAALKAGPELRLKPVSDDGSGEALGVVIESTPSDGDTWASGGDNSGSLSNSAEVNYQLDADTQSEESASFADSGEDGFYSPYGDPQVNLPRSEESAGSGSPVLADMPLATRHGSGVRPGKHAGFRSRESSDSEMPEMPKMPAAASSSEGKDALAGMPLELFEIVDTPLDQAITLLVAPSNMNIIVDSSVGDNSVSLSFKQGQTDLKGALDLLTKAYGLDYVVEAGTIVVASKDKISGSFINLESRLFELSYADPLRVKTIIENSLFKTDPAEVNKSPEKIFVYGGEDFKDPNEGSRGGGAAAGGGAGGAAAGAGGAGGDAGGGGGGGEGGGGNSNKLSSVQTIDSNMSSAPPNALMVYCTPEKMKKVEEMIAKLDRKPTIVELEVRVCEVTDTALKDLGVVVQDSDGNNRSEGVSQGWSEAPSGRDLDGDLIPSFEAFSIGSMFRNGLNFSARLNTLIENGKVETLAQPVLSTVIDKQAKYFAGERIPYVAKVSITNNTIQQEVEFIDVGVTLSFKPRLDENGNLTIQVDPDISSLVEFVPIGGGAVAPRTLNRQLSTTVRVQDCEPFVMAGLITKREKETIEKIPGLADLPWIGKWFRNKNRDNQRTEVIVIVTPKLHQ